VNECYSDSKMTVSPRKKLSVVGTRSLRGGVKTTVTAEDWVAGSSFSFKVSPTTSPRGGAVQKKVTPKNKARRQSVMLKRLELPEEGNKLSPIFSRRTRRMSMINVSSQKTVVTETTKMARSTSAKALPVSRNSRSKPSNKASVKSPATKPLPPKVPVIKNAAVKNNTKSVSPAARKIVSPKIIKKIEVSPKVILRKLKSPPRSASKTTRSKAATPEILKTVTPPKVPASKKSAVKNTRKSVSPAATKETSPKNLKKNQVSSKVTVMSASKTKITKTILKTEQSPASPASPEKKPHEVTFSPIKFYSSPKKSATPHKRKSLVMTIDKDVSFNYSPVLNRKRKFDGTPTPEADTENKPKRRKIARSSAKSKLPMPDKSSKDTPKAPKVTRSKAILKTPKGESSAKSPEIKTPAPISPDEKTPDTKIQAPKSNMKKSTMKKTPESRKSIKSSMKKPTPSPKVSAKKPTPSPKVSTKKRGRPTTKSTKKVKISAESPEGSSVEYRKTPKSEKPKTKVVTDVGASPELKPASELLANIRDSPIKSRSKLKPYTPKPDPTPSRVLKQTMKKKAAKDMQAIKVAAKKIETSSLVDPDIVVMKTPVQLTRTPLRKTSLVKPDTPSSTSNLPPTPTSSRKTLSVRRNNGIAKRELLNRPSPPRSSTPIKGDGSPEPEIADPDVTDINDEIVVVKEASALITTTEIITTEVTVTTSVEGHENGVVKAIVTEENGVHSSDLNGSAVANVSQEVASPTKSRWRYCSVM